MVPLKCSFKPLERILLHFDVLDPAQKVALVENTMMVLIELYFYLWKEDVLNVVLFETVQEVVERVHKACHQV